MNIILTIIPFFISILFNEDKKYILVKIENKSDRYLYVKDVFKYFRYDDLDGLSDDLFEFYVGGISKYINFENRYCDKISCYSYMKDSSSCVYSNTRSKDNELVYLDPDFNEEKIVRKSPLIPMAPHSYYLFAIPTSEYLFHKKYYQFDCSDLKDSTNYCRDSLFICATAAIWYSEKNSGKLRDFKSVETRSDSLWFKLKD